MVSVVEHVQPFWVAGCAVTSAETMGVVHPYDGVPVATVALPSAGDIEDAVAAAHAARQAVAGCPAHVRASALWHVSDGLGRRSEEVAELVVAESGKPLRWARAEVARAVSTFRWAAEEARRWSGVLQRLDTDPGSVGRVAVTRRFPRGPVLGITPFNFPLNLVAHKLAPAIAVGAPIIIKPAPATPLSALLLGQLLAETDLPAGAWSVLPVPNHQMAPLIVDARLPVISFTGSGPIGWSIRDAVPRKHVTLELGGNAAAVVCDDWSGDEDLDWAAQRVATFANYQAGQSCISVQRVYADDSIYDRFVGKLAEQIRGLCQGDPRDKETVVGPLINEAAAARVEKWVDEARTEGAQVLVGGRREGTSYAPTLLVDVPQDALVLREEVFGPIVSVIRVDGTDAALAAVNDSPYGLQAGVFTHDMSTAFRAHRDLEVGGVIIGDVPSYRADQMPYGGVKMSGMGREGVRSAMEDLSTDRVLVLSGLDL